MIKRILIEGLKKIILLMRISLLWILFPRDASEMIESKVKLTKIREEKVVNSEITEKNLESILRNIPKFTGRQTEWASFKRYFTQVVKENKLLTSIEKGAYLISSTEQEAKELVKYYDLDSTNFEEVWHKLCQEYQNPRRVQSRLEEVISEETSESKIEKLLTHVEEDEEELFEIKTKRLNNGRYEAELPFISDQRPEPNLDIAQKRAKALFERVKKQNFDKIFEEEVLKFEKQGHAFEIKEELDKGYYIPLQEVIRENAESTKVRIVMNPTVGKIPLNEVLFNLDTGASHEEN